MDFANVIDEAYYAKGEVRPFDIMLMYQYWTNKRQGIGDEESKIKAAQMAITIAIRVMRGRKTPAEYVATKTKRPSIAKKKILSKADWLSVWNKAAERLGTNWKSYLQRVKELVDEGVEYNEVKKRLGVVSKLPWKKGK